ncbi:MAG: carbohydrate ABC transporter permease [Actinomycetales bacterium]|nr:carbohydrate ABC transporter permease [Actinomycetales bacterium]
MPWSGRRRRRRRRSDPAAVPAFVLAVAVAALTLVPVIYVVLGGFTSTAQLAEDPVGMPDPWMTGNYGSVLSSARFWRQLGNSLLIALLATGLVVAVGSLAAFAVSRYVFRGRELVYTVFTLGLLFPVGVAILPLYLMLRELHLLDNPLGVAVPQAAFSIPVTIVVLRPFMAAVPNELEDAAAIDGCSGFAFFWRILLPLSRPALTTVSVLAFVTSWNAYLLPLLVLNDEQQHTLPLGTAMFSTQYTQDTARVLAFTALSMVPALVFFVLAERRIVGGLTGAVKG